MKKLFLLDAYALIYRAYYGFINRPLINSKGNNTSAIFGFVKTLEEVLKKENPDFIAVAFDVHGPTFRHEVFPEYKAQREETPDGIKFAVPIIKQILAAYNIPVLECEGYEADDIIGTLATQAQGIGDLETYMMTPDKDYGQLVKGNVRMYKPRHDGGYDIQGEEYIKQKYGIQDTKQVIDLEKCPIEWTWFDASQDKAFVTKVAPLPLLLAMGNGRGGGDYHDAFEGYMLVGSWCGSSQYISVTSQPLADTEDYEEFAPDFTEQRPAITWNEEAHEIEKCEKAGRRNVPPAGSLKGVNSELRYQEQSAADLRKIKICLAISILENPKTDHFINELVCNLLIITFTDPDKDCKALSNAGFSNPVNFNFCRSDALNNKSH